VQLEAWVFLQPRPHLGPLVGGVVVENYMDVARFLHGPIDPAEEGQEVPGAVAEHAVAGDQARLDVQRGEQRGGAMALVIVGHGGRASLLEGQPRLGPIQCLDLGLLVDAEHHGPIRRVEVEPDDVGDPILEQRDVRDLEPLHDVRLQTGIRPYAPHAPRRNAHRLGHHRAAPVRGIGRRLLHGLRDDFQPDLPRQGRHARGQCLVAFEPRHAFIEIPLLPAPDRRLRHSRPPHDLDGAPTVRRRQHDICPPDKLARRVAVAQQGLKLSAVGGAKVKADVGTSHPPIMPRRSSVGNPMSGGEHSC